jgi:hypothetical protein
MTNDRQSGTTIAKPNTLKACRWCGGPLVYQPHFPVLRLAPGEPQLPADAQVPHALRTLPAWVCSTPFCKYREKA